MFLNIQIYVMILKKYDMQFTLTTKNHCISSLNFNSISKQPKIYKNRDLYSLSINKQHNS